jgi:hypothetical protein
VPPSFFQIRTKKERCHIRFLEECVPPVTASGPTLVLGLICGVAVWFTGVKSGDHGNPLS